jgi:hypothetical protein
MMQLLKRFEKESNSDEIDLFLQGGAESDEAGLAKRLGDLDIGAQNHSYGEFDQLNQSRICISRRFVVDSDTRGTEQFS